MLRNVSQDDSYVFKVPICQTLNDADIPLGYPLHRMHRLPPPPPLFLATGWKNPHALYHVTSLLSALMGSEEGILKGKEGKFYLCK